jgi:hypothetical protein
MLDIIASFEANEFQCRQDLERTIATVEIRLTMSQGIRGSNGVLAREGGIIGDKSRE